MSAALELLDAEGIDALSMRKLGTRLNAGATSIYTHVANKDELLDLVVDEVYGEIEMPATGDPAGWRAAIACCAHSMRTTLLRHPWIVSVLGEAGLAYLGPNVLRLQEAILAVLEEGGFSLEAADQAMNTIVAYIIGASTSEAAWLTTLARSGQGEQEWADRLWPAALQAVEAYPRLRSLYAAQRAQSLSDNRDDDFDIGLECVLNGVAARLAPHAAR
ncbi:TetR/AcrR family transcriptional regulator [Nonomuraea turcica]|uniref:TetR/AcrR family transcriptional regulator n=1 Tax=Nonomuraea sp. G32 TaxID=3067274 RepID=UPI00273C16C3|nr:TetR/AcrR family transcriptional regulator [Nonomuraea sp. G32]MDP4507313.1 TetR/AcrR family transcriptional regulator [Nonomuraea sp. G32]